MRDPLTGERRQTIAEVVRDFQYAVIEETVDFIARNHFATFPSAWLVNGVHGAQNDDERAQRVCARSDLIEEIKEALS